MDWGERAGRGIPTGTVRAAHHQLSPGDDLTMRMSVTPQFSAEFLSVQNFCAWSGLGRTKVYDLITTGHLNPLKCGRRTLIPMAEAIRWRDALPSLRPTANPARVQPQVAGVCASPAWNGRSSEKHLAGNSNYRNDRSVA